MSNYRVTYESGRTIDVGHAGSHAPSTYVLAEAEKLEDVHEPAVLIERDPGTPAALTVWYRPYVEETEAEPLPLLLFVAFVYDDGQTPEGLPIIVHGNTLLEMEFEPCIPEHIDGLQNKIAAYIGSKRVVLTGWKKVDRS